MADDFESFKQYLESTEYIDWKTPEVLATATSLADGLDEHEEIARKCFEFVRDEIQHSWDYKLNPVTCKASDVLHYGTGYCYAKSHLLAALLRANGIPAGLCYQRLTITDVPPFCLHGLNAVYLQPLGWYRVDARGNKQGVSAEFCPPVEKLAFPIITTGEADFMEVWAEPLPIVIRALKEGKTFQEVADNLPDVELVAAGK
ncbi:MAG: transglutaminase family protein [Alcanivoracaceae bacterium]|nr:transglutaminase family protein [Alcanivoracaceae bacterium]